MVPLEPTPQCDNTDQGSFNKLFWLIAPAAKNAPADCLEDRYQE